MAARQATLPDAAIDVPPSKSPLTLFMGGAEDRARFDPSTTGAREPPVRSLTASADACHVAVSAPVDLSDEDVIARVRAGDSSQFEVIVRRYQARLFATARRHARREDEVEDIVQEIFLKAFQRLGSFRGDAPFEHWLMRLAVRTCFDFLRAHQRNREDPFTDLSDDESTWLERFARDSTCADCDADAARTLVRKVMERLSPPARLVITLLELEDRSVREISELTGWSVPLVKVRAFRARAEMRRILQRLSREKYL